MKKIILDTNFLLIPYNFKVDIFSEIHRICNFKYEIYVLDRTIDELNGIIKKQKGRHRGAAKFGLSLTAKTKPLKSNNKNLNKSVDDIIRDMVDKNTIVATQDRILKSKLRKQGIPVIILRQKKYLELLG